MKDELREEIKIGAVVIAGVLLVLVLIAGGVFGASAVRAKYRIWEQARAGQAELARADWNRQIAVREAQAKEQSAVELAKAEVDRARGVAKANQIIGKSLEHNQSYLTYLWIQNLANEHNQVIYVPTENNLPILEANRLNHLKK